MGPIFALVFVLTAAAASFFPISQKDFIDVFRTVPSDMGFERDGFYQNYWGNPAIGLNHRYWNGPVPFSYEYRTQNYIGNHQLSFQELFERPIMMVTPSAAVPNSFTVFYLHNGLRSLYRFKSFGWLQQYVRTPGMKGLVFFPQYLYNVRFFETPISSVVIQEDCRMSDFSIISGSSNNFPYLFVAPESVFDSMHFENIAKVSDFKVYNDIIEVLSPFSWLQNQLNYFGGSSGSNSHSSSSSGANSIVQSGSMAGAQSSSLAGTHSGSVAGAESSSLSAAQAGSIARADTQNFATAYSGAQSASHSQAGSIEGSLEERVARNHPASYAGSDSQNYGKGYAGAQSSSSVHSQVGSIAGIQTSMESGAQAETGNIAGASALTTAESRSIASAGSIAGSSLGSLSRSESLTYAGSKSESSASASSETSDASSASVAGAQSTTTL